MPSWSDELLERRRGMHGRIDTLALTDPDAAARHRLALYTLTNEYNQGDLSMHQLEMALDLLNTQLGPGD